MADISLTNLVISAAEKHSLFKNGDSIAVALSGGADSICLLNILYSLKGKYNLTLSACHLNHKIRGAEALRDVEFVRSTCKSMGIPLYLKEADIPALALARKQSQELCAREERYSFFEEISSRYGVKIATAHTASDNFETLLYNIARGVSFNGMQGILPKRENIIRPLIFATRAQVEQYCAENSLSYVTDSTNLSDLYTRNKIRHNAVPTLLSVNPGAEKKSVELCGDFIELNTFLEKYIGDILHKASKTVNGVRLYSAHSLNNLDGFVKKQAVFRIFRESGVSGVSRRHIELCTELLKNGGELDLDINCKAVCSQGMFRIINKEAFLGAEAVALAPTSIRDGLVFSYNGFGFSVKCLEPDENSESDRDSESEGDLVRCGLVGEIPVFRTRLPGDTVFLQKRNIKKSLKKFMIEERIPRELRDSLVVLACKSRVLWIQGCGAVDSCRSGGALYRIRAFALPENRDNLTENK